MHTILLEFSDHLLHDSDICDAHTHSAVIDLFVHGIHASQAAHNTIILHDTRDLTVALMLLSNSSLYTAKIASK